MNQDIPTILDPRNPDQGKHPYWIRKSILERLEKLKSSMSEEYEGYLDAEQFPPNEAQAIKEYFSHAHYLAFDELLHAVEWLIKNHPISE
jgi:hypothetical protein